MADVSGADRGVSTVAGYVLNIGVALLLVTGLLVAASGYVSEQRHRAIRSELSVAGSHLADDIATADRLNGSGATASVRADLPREVVGRSYTVTVSSDPSGPSNTVIITLTAPASGVSVTRRVETSVSVAGTTTRAGGPLRITVENDGLVVRDA